MLLYSSCVYSMVIPPQLGANLTARFIVVKHNAAGNCVCYPISLYVWRVTFYTFLKQGFTNLFSFGMCCIYKASVNARSVQQIMPYLRGSQIPIARSSHRPHSVLSCPVFVVRQYGTSIITPFWRKEFWDGSQMFGQLVQPCLCYLAVAMTTA